MIAILFEKAKVTSSQSEAIDILNDGTTVTMSFEGQSISFPVELINGLADIFDAMADPS